MRYGFAIDQRTCIGCHACTVACKTEHEIPVGQFRTWVKYVDRGTFPDSTRDFAVMRCNHCTDAPCVKICPTHALFTRDDGIVDFDSDNCIGCKSCQQACPYDAIYIDEDTHTAAKCNFCAHRVDAGLEPACVVVCPTHSIWVGDLDDPSSGIARLVADNPVAVRAPEQQTGPNVFYLGADRAVLDPLAAPADRGSIWSRTDEHRASVAPDLRAPAEVDDPGAPRTTLNTAHPRPWGWRVTTYLWTKAVAAGALILAALAWLLGAPLGPVGDVVAPVLGVLGVAVTGGLLVWDLKRPERFYYLLTRPNPRSWLFLGALALGLGAGASVLWLGAAVLVPQLAVLRTALAFVALLGGVLTTGYTAFLFGQAEGRDLWQSPLLFWHLVVQAVFVGGGALAVAAYVTGVTGPGRTLVVAALAGGAVLHVAFVVLEGVGKHPTPGATAAAHLMTRGRYARTFRLGLAGAGLAAVLAVAGAAGPFWLAALGGLVAQAALLAHESVFVRAGQDVPLS